MGLRRRGWRGRAIVGAPLAASLLAAACAGAAGADAPPAGTAIVSVLPANETKILQLSPAPVPAPAPAPVPAAVTSSATSATVTADSPGLRALVAASNAERQRLAGEVARLEADAAVARAAFDGAQQELSSRQGAGDGAQAVLDAARSALAEADRRVGAEELAAVTAADAMGGQRTPVARPPSPGHTLQDAAAHAREALAAAQALRDAQARTVVARQQDRDAAGQATAAAAGQLTAQADRLQQSLGALEQARQDLATAERAPAPAAAGDSVTLRPAPSALATATIPADYLVLYGRAAATCTGLPWVVLAAVGSVESAHGQSGAPGVRTGTNVAGAMGPMQFLAGTWAAYGVDGDGNGVRDVYQPADAVFGAANYLCASGAGAVSTLRAALWSYNHADWYVEAVLQLAARFVRTAA